MKNIHEISDMVITLLRDTLGNLSNSRAADNSTLSSENLLVPMFLVSE